MNKPRKSRKPKPPTGCQAVWRNVGWRFRACPSIAGKRVFGPWRETKDLAAQDYLDIRERGDQVAETPELVTFEEGLRLLIERATERGFRKRTVQPCSEGTVRFYLEVGAVLYSKIDPTALLVEFTPADITDYLRRRASEDIRHCACERNEVVCPHPRKLSGDRLNKERQVLGLVFRTAIEAGKHPGPNPVDLVDRYGHEVEEAPHKTAEQIGEILGAIKDREQCQSAQRFHDIVAVLFLTGMRIGELAHVQRKHVDLKRGTLKVPDGKSGSRTIPLCAVHIAVLKRMTENLGAGEFLLEGDTHARRTGNLTSNAFRRWRERIPEELREGFHAHTFRHSFQTHLLESGAPIHHVKRLMGHKGGGDITMRYAHATPLQWRHSMAKAFDGLTETLFGLDSGSNSSAAAV